MNKTESSQRVAGTMIRLDSVSKSYSTPAGEVIALRDINWRVGAGEAVAIMGPSGCGKTTLLNLIGSMDRVSKGHVEVDGLDLTQMSEREAEDFRLRKVGFIFQFFNLVPSLTAAQNLELPMVLAGAPQADRVSRVEELLAAFGLADKGHKRPEELSGGEQQRIAVCLALVNDPDLILADGPTGNLDVANMEIIAELLLSLATDRGKTVLVTTHDQKLGHSFPSMYYMRDGSFEDGV